MSSSINSSCSWIGFLAEMVLLPKRVEQNRIRAHFFTVFFVFIWNPPVLLLLHLPLVT